MANNTIVSRLFSFARKELFRYSILIKGFDGVVEIGIGVMLLVIRPETINQIILSYVNDELLEEPKSIIANFLLHHGHISTNEAVFTATLLLLRGIVKLLVVTGLLERKIWVYPLAIIVFALFVVFQLYTFVSTHSLFLLLLSFFDLFVIGLTLREYRILQKEKTT